jgi:ribulose kinase
VVCRITADVFGLPVKRIQTPEACSIGSSMAAFVAMGVFGAMPRPRRHGAREGAFTARRGEPQDIYGDIRKAYSKIYGSSSPYIKASSKSIKGDNADEQT